MSLCYYVCLVCFCCFWFLGCILIHVVGFGALLFLLFVVCVVWDCVIILSCCCLFFVVPRVVVSLVLLLLVSFLFDVLFYLRFPCFGVFVSCFGFSSSSVCLFVFGS